MHTKQGTIALGMSDSVSVTVTRGLEGIRLAVLGIIVTVGLSAAQLSPVSWPAFGRIAVGFAASALGCVLFRWPWSRNKLMTFAHKITGV